MYDSNRPFYKAEGGVGRVLGQRAPAPQLDPFVSAFSPVPVTDEGYGCEVSRRRNGAASGREIWNRRWQALANLGGTGELRGL